MTVTLTVRTMLARVLLVAGLAAAAIADAATVSRIQRGTTASTGAGTVVVTIADVDMSRSMLVFQTRHGGNRPTNALIRGELTSSTRITFTRVASDTARVDIAWTLVEFATGVRVQRGTVNQTATAVNVALPIAVGSTNDAFVLFSKTPASGDTTWGSSHPVSVRLVSTSTLRVHATAATPSHVVAWQVVEYTDPTDISVTHGSTSMATGSKLALVGTTATDVRKAWLLAGFTVSGSGTDISSRMIDARLLGSRIEFRRDDDDVAINRIDYQLIRFADGTETEHFYNEIDQGDASISRTVTFTAAPERMIVSSAIQAGGGQNFGSVKYDSDDRVGEGATTFSISGATVTATRSSSNDDSLLGWFALQFPAEPAATEVATWSFDELAWQGVAGEVVDSSGDFDGRALGGVTTIADGQVCRAGDFPDNSTAAPASAVDTGLDISSDVGSRGTVAFWYRANDDWVGGGDRMLVDASVDPKYFHVMLRNSGALQLALEDDTDRDIVFSTPVQARSAGEWVHIAVTWDYPADRRRIFIDGVELATDTTNATATIGNAGTLYIGDNRSTYHPSGTDGAADGQIDEVVVRSEPLDAAALAVLIATTRTCRVPIASYSMDESAWSGVAGEVLDGSGGGRHATASGSAATAASTPALPGDPGTCRYGDVAHGGSGITDGIRTPLNLDAETAGIMTLAFWYRADAAWAGGTINHLFGASRSTTAQIFRLVKEGDGRLRLSLSTSIHTRLDLRSSAGTGFGAGQWHHVAVVLDLPAGSARLYVDGTPTAFSFSAAATVDWDLLVIGDDATSAFDAFGGRAAEGLIDEFQVYALALADGEIAALVDQTHPCGAPAGVAGFQVSHDGSGIHCLPEAVTITALDATGAVVDDYAGSITLATDSGTGSWLPDSGDGVLVDATAGDGAAVYTFAPSDLGTATVLLDYRTGAASVDIDVADTGDPALVDRDDEGALQFAASGYVLTATAQSNPPAVPVDTAIPALTAGVAGTLHLTAYGQTPEDPQCGVIETHAGAHPLAWWTEPDDPVALVRTVAVDGVDSAASEGAALPQAVTFTAGQASVAVRYRDSGRIRLGVREDTAAGALRGATTAFVVRPADFVIGTVADGSGNPNPGTSSPAGASFVAAGAPFTVAVTAVDSDGGPLPSFGLEQVPEALTLESSALVWPAGGRHGSGDDGALGQVGGVVRTGAGTFAASAVSFDEVGTIRIRARLADGDFLGSGDIAGTPSGPVGRFRPAAVTVDDRAISAACGTFSYLDQPGLGIRYTLTARNAAGGVVANHDSVLLGAAGTGVATLVAEAGDDGVDRGDRLSPADAGFVAGVAALDVADGLMARLAAVDGPFGALQVGVRLAGSPDGLVVGGADMAADASGDCTVGAACTARTLGAPQRIVYGRLRVAPASGSELAALAVPVEAQAWDGSAFVVEAADACTTYSAAQAALGNFTGDLGPGETAASQPLVATPLVGGVSTALPLLLTAPGAGNTGGLELTFDAPAWLQFDWSGAGSADPVAPILFGRYRGHDRIIFWQEVR